MVSGLAELSAGSLNQVALPNIVLRPHAQIAHPMLSDLPEHGFIMRGGILPGKSQHHAGKIPHVIPFGMTGDLD